jgi:hypothetical protein
LPEDDGPSNHETETNNSQTQETPEFTAKVRLVEQQILASNLFKDFLNHQSLDRCAAAIKDSLSLEHAMLINEYIQDLERLGPSAGHHDLQNIFHLFCANIHTIEARKKTHQIRMIFCDKPASVYRMD